MSTLMQLELCRPTGVLWRRSVSKILAPGLHGSFCILPKHADAVAVIKPGIVSYVSEGKTRYVAVDEGVLTKQGSRLILATLRALEGTHLETLAEELSTLLKSQTEDERRTRSTLAGLESKITRGLAGLEQQRG